jgi:hypothetical protein
MRKQINARLIALKAEYSRGQAQLGQSEHQVGSVRETLLRISGSVLVLEEFLSFSELVKTAEQARVQNGAHPIGHEQRELRRESLTLDRTEN